jgi:hypothetical protein
VGLLGRMFGTDEASTQVSGLSGQATIVSLREGGPYVNDRPTLTMELDVDLPGRERYRAQAKQNVGRLVIGRLRPGTTIPVRVDPKDPAKVVVDESPMLGRPDAPVEPGDPLEKLQRLTELRDAGALTEEEFTAKKAEILQDL